MSNCGLLHDPNAELHLPIIIYSLSSVYALAGITLPLSYSELGKFTHKRCLEMSALLEILRLMLLEQV